MGSLLGLLTQRLLPSAVSGLVPVEMETAVSWSALLMGLAVGLCLSLLFTLIPLAPVRKVSPLLALRSDFEEALSKWDGWVIGAYTLLFAGLLFFSLWLSESLLVGLGFFGGLLAVFTLLYFLSRTIMSLAKRNFPSSWRYEYRQGLANLYRPHNQTTVLVLALGLGTFFLLTIHMTQASLLREVELTAEGIRPNLIFFDIQSDQKGEIAKIFQSKQLPILQNVPIVTMRLSSINNRSVQEIRDAPDRNAREWALLREYRCTYRDRPVDTEKILEGTFQGTASEDSVRVSMEEGIAEQLQVSVGDRLVFDVQGIPVETTVGSIREVDWRNFQPNFFIVFPTGVLEKAPQFHVFVTRTESPEISAEVQRAVVKLFPNVSAIDLSLIIETIDTILDQVVVAIRFMAVFCMVTGFVVLMGAIVSGRYQRLRESALLRTLGASGRQIHRILLAEYSLLGLLAAFMGVLLALVGSWALTTFLFDTAFLPSLPPILGVTAAVILLTVIIGMLNSQGILDHPPMEVLRAED
jgi:putative ABC transport system permease protein